VADWASRDLVNNNKLTDTLAMPCLSAGTGLDLFLIKEQLFVDHHFLLITAIATTAPLLIL
jgi:hypothetical protein